VWHFGWIRLGIWDQMEPSDLTHETGKLTKLGFDAFYAHRKGRDDMEVTWKWSLHASGFRDALDLSTKTEDSVLSALYFQLVNRRGARKQMTII